MSIKHKAKYTTAFEDNTASSCKRICTRVNSDALEVTVWSWFKRARCKKIPVSSAMIKEEALKVADRLSLTESIG